MEIKLVDLKKSYGSKQALNGVTLDLTEGIHGLLGPNGAGKTTIMNILTGNLNQTSGEVLFDGMPIRELGEKYRRRLGYMPQQQTLYPSFTAEQFLYYIAALRGLKRRQAANEIDRLLKLLWLDDVRGKKIRALSGGMKQRLLLAQALLADPDILILDEPTAGLDPKQRIIVRNMIAEVALKKIVLISTHVVSDVESVAKNIILLSDGKVLRQDTPGALQNELTGKVWELCVPEELTEELKQYGTVCAMAKGENTVHVRMLAEKKPPFEGTAVRPILEDVYLSFFGDMEDICDMR